MQLVLTVSDGPEEGRKITLTEGQSLTIGREAPADIAISSDGYMSGRHFTVEVVNNVAILHDLGSRNRTKVNGQFIKEISLDSGDIILAGHTEFLVDVQEPSQRFATTLEDMKRDEIPPGGYDPAEPQVPLDASPLGTSPLGTSPLGTSPPGTSPPGTSPPVPSPRQPTGSSDVFDSPFDQPTPKDPSSIGEPGLSSPPVSQGGVPDAPLPSTPKKNSASPIQSLVGSSSPLFGGDSGDSGFGGVFDNLPDSEPKRGSSPLMSMAAGMGPVGSPPISGPTPPIENLGAGDFDPNAFTTPTASAPPPPSAPPAAQIDPPALGTDTASDQLAPAADPAPVINGAGDESTSDKAAVAPIGKERKHFVADPFGAIPPLAGSYRNCVRVDCPSTLVHLVSAGSDEEPLSGAALLNTLKDHFELVLTIHCQKAGQELPQELWSAAPLFDWLPRETSLFYCPVALPFATFVEGNQLELIDNLWGQDALVVFLVKKGAPEAVDYLVQLRHKAIPGISGEGGFFGFAWPSVVAQLLQNQPADIATGILGEHLAGAVIESEGGWQFVGETQVVEQLVGCGFTVSG